MSGKKIYIDEWKLKKRLGVTQLLIIYSEPIIGKNHNQLN